MNDVIDPCPAFRATHPEAAVEGDVAAYLIPDQDGLVPALVLEVAGAQMWLAPADVERFIDWVRYCAAA